MPTCENVRAVPPDAAMRLGQTLLAKMAGEFLVFPIGVAADL
jgi:hypothetical protein